MSLLARLRGRQAQGAESGPGGHPLPAAGRDDGRMPAGSRPDLLVLDEDQIERVGAVLRDRGWRCESCGGRAVVVGEALYLGFLFRSEDLDAYMVGLTCVNPACPHPRDGIRLRGADFGAR